MTGVGAWEFTGFTPLPRGWYRQGWKQRIGRQLIQATVEVPFTSPLAKAEINMGYTLLTFDLADLEPGDGWIIGVRVYGGGEDRQLGYNDYGKPEGVIRQQRKALKVVLDDLREGARSG
jgi:hypothetical protein